MPPSNKGPILIVDDDQDIREAILDTLEDEGYAVALAHDGSEALGYLQSNPPPPLILLDWNMAPMNGAAFMQELSKQPAFRDVPVVLLTADARVIDKANAYPFAGYLKKPIDLSQLFAVLDRYAGA